MSDDDLLRLGFVRAEDGSFLLPPTTAVPRLIPIGRFLKIRLHPRRRQRQPQHHRGRGAARRAEAD
jgi:hypothetical protein